MRAIRRRRSAAMQARVLRYGFANPPDDFAYVNFQGEVPDIQQA